MPASCGERWGKGWQGGSGGEGRPSLSVRKRATVPMPSLFAHHTHTHRETHTHPRLPSSSLSPLLPFPRSLPPPSSSSPSSFLSTAPSTSRLSTYTRPTATTLSHTVQFQVKLSANNYTEVMYTLANVGPVAVNVDAIPMQSYGGGLMTGCAVDKSHIDHVVQLVGYVSLVWLR